MYATHVSTPDPNRIDRFTEGPRPRVGGDSEPIVIERTVIVEAPPKSPLTFSQALLLDLFLMVKIAGGCLTAIYLARTFGLFDAF